MPRADRHTPSFTLTVWPSEPGQTRNEDVDENGALAGRVEALESALDAVIRAVSDLADVLEKRADPEVLTPASVPPRQP